MAEHLKKQLAVRLDDESHKRLNRLAKRHGGKAATIEAALRLLDGRNDMSDEEAIEWLRSRLKVK
jgi:predicted DNA-binding protein